MQRNTKTLSDYLRDYKNKFSKDLDEVWDKYDDDANNLLDKSEAKPFVEEICTLLIDKERAKNYDPERFDSLF